MESQEQDPDEDFTETQPTPEEDDSDQEWKKDLPDEPADDFSEDPLKSED